MLIFSDWIIKTDGDLIARQYDNLTRELLVMGTLPEGWSWELLVQAGGSVNVIALSPRSEGVGVTLTAEMLTKAGLYALQLRGGRGEEVRHTNVIQVVVPTSLVGDATWPELPSEFSQAEANIRALNAHPPIPGDNGYWLLWDLEAGDYTQSQLPLPEVSVGPQGPEGKAASVRVGDVTTGEPGTQAAVSNSGTENDAILDFVLPRGQIGPTGPSGADGRDGKDGVPGAAATIRVGAVATGEPGTQAQVINTGTENAAVLQFTIPQGRPGADGMDGKDGRDGEPGPAGVGVPEIGADDEGRVMTARSGQAVWEALSAQGGAADGLFLIELTERNGRDWVNKTFFEIYNAYMSGKIPVVVDKRPLYPSPVFSLMYIKESIIMFSSVSWQINPITLSPETAVMIGQVLIAPDDQVTTYSSGFMFNDPLILNIQRSETGDYSVGMYSTTTTAIERISTGNPVYFMFFDPDTQIVHRYMVSNFKYVGDLAEPGVDFRAQFLAESIYYSERALVKDTFRIESWLDSDLFWQSSVQRMQYEFPLYTADDEGKILKIVDGVPAWVTP